MASKLEFLEFIKENNSRNLKIKSVLMLDNEKMNFIGDCCFRFNKFRYIKEYLDCSEIILNYNECSNKTLYETLLKNNPYVNEIQDKEWDSISFQEFDVVFVISYSESLFLDYLYQRYNKEVLLGSFKTKIYSISSVTLKKDEFSDFIFPEYPKILDVVKNLGPGEIYLDKNEIKDSNDWLIKNGVTESDKVFVMVDSSSTRSKLLNLVEYFELIKLLLSLPDVKILIFDENSIGKKEFYKEWLGEENASKLIVSEGKSLRFNISLLASKFINMIFGPCTGIMHCSSSVYNNFLNSGINKESIPLMIVYTGIYGVAEMGVDFWWGSSPLIKCLLLKKRNDCNQIVQLTKLEACEIKDETNSLPCSEYKAQSLFQFLNKELLFNKKYLN